MNQRLFGLGFLFLVMLVWSGCDSGEYGEGTKTEPEMEVAPMAETEPPPTTTTTEPPSLAGTAEAGGAIVVAAGTAGSEENNEGVNHYQQEHYDVAQEHFMKAVEANAELPEAHYNLALALDKLDKHQEATTHFKKALELAPSDPQIAESEILQKHVGG